MSMRPKNSTLKKEYTQLRKRLQEITDTRASLLKQVSAMNVQIRDLSREYDTVQTRFYHIRQTLQPRNKRAYQKDYASLEEKEEVYG